MLRFFLFFFFLVFYADKQMPKQVASASSARGHLHNTCACAACTATHAISSSVIRSNTEKKRTEKKTTRKERHHSDRFSFFFFFCFCSRATERPSSEPILSLHTPIERGHVAKVLTQPANGGAVCCA